MHNVYRIYLDKFYENINYVPREVYNRLASDSIYTMFHDKVEQLTGDRWCPYPSLLLVHVTMCNFDNDILKSLIYKRRTYSAPELFKGDPQQKKLEELAKKHDLYVTVGPGAEVAT